MDYQPSYGFLKDCLYRSESYKVTLADAYELPSKRARRLQPHGFCLEFRRESLGAHKLPPMLKA